jgi:tetratricopeptide (TPR) repeat protein
MSPVLLVLLALVQRPLVPSDRYLPAYLAIVGGYARGERTRALGAMRTWRLADVDSALSALRNQGNNLRAVTAFETDIDFRLVEAAVLLHAEVGLLHLQASAWGEGSWHVGRSASLFDWSRIAARQLRERAAKRRARGPTAGVIEPLPRALDIQERIPPRDYYVAVAASVLAFGQGPAARDFAERALTVAPDDAEAHLVLGCAAEYVAGEQVLKDDASAARRLSAKAEAAFRQARALDPALFEARLRLGYLLLTDGRVTEGETVLAEAEGLAGDERGRYLARLFLGRAAERGGRPADAAGFYRRALEAWPSAQTARLALAHAGEKAGDPAAARAQVTASLDASRRDDRPSDPFWVYPFGPPGLAQAALQRVFAAIERP